MKTLTLLPGFSSHQDDWAIPVQQNLARLLSTRLDLTILALRYPHRRDCYLFGGATVYSLGAGQVRGFRRIKLWWEAILLIEKLHRAQPFDLLHAMWADETGLIAAWAGRRLGIPVVVSILGGELIGFNDIHYGLQRSRFSRWIVGQALNGADRIIVPSEYVRRLIPPAGYIIPDAKIVKITLGADAKRFTPADASVNSYHLIHVASLVPVKNQVLLLRAFAQLDQYATLDIVGTGTEQPKLEALARELGIADRVRFVGAVAHPDLPSYYRQAAIHVLTSRHETIALTTLEAAACGVPTVSTDVGIVPDYPELGLTETGGATDGQSGSADGLAQMIQALIDSPDRRSDLSRSARRIAEGELSIEATAEQLIDLYQELTGKA